jgi:hypothetical protein
VIGLLGAVIFETVRILKTFIYPILSKKKLLGGFTAFFSFNEKA